ncbi:MAG: right-handed parallel beta-helix repeat-containing protein [Bacteroidaceae bacterium]|nr:right-handed parallel beta-helix repeat-containing protein [Bacteroidaceae bacterium]
MNTSFILLLNCIFAALNVQATVVSSEGGHIANGRYVIPAGNHIVRIVPGKKAWLTVGDNTELVIEGNVLLEGNGFSQCDIIRVTGRNVQIHGKGSIVGDKFTHTGSEGEWGMGISFRGASNATLRGLTIKNCWGDCVYVGKKSEKITIENCHLDNGRRQGISVTSAQGVMIRNCTIANVHGTNPQYAIDIEPNENCTINDVLIDHVDVVNCEGGFRALTYKVDERHALIGSVEIRNCSVSAKSRYPIHLNRCRQAKVEHCIIDGTNDRPSIYANYVDHLRVRNNTLNVSVQLSSSVINKTKEIVGLDAYAPIRVDHSSTKDVVNNRIVEK